MIKCEASEQNGGETRRNPAALCGTVPAPLRCRARWRRARSGCSAFLVPTTSSTSTTATRTCPTWFPTSRRAASPRTTNTRPSARSRRRQPTPPSLRSTSQTQTPIASRPSTPTTRWGLCITTTGITTQRMGDGRTVI